MEVKSVKVRVPGTSANCGPGFDCLGVACTIYNELELTLLEEERLDIEITGDGAENIPVDERNIVWRSIQKLLERAGKAQEHLKQQEKYTDGQQCHGYCRGLEGGK